LEKIYLQGCGVNPKTDTVVYCRIGERSSHTWFVLTYLLGLNNVRNYDGSWTEWGNRVAAPIEKGRNCSRGRWPRYLFIPYNARPATRLQAHFHFDRQTMADHVGAAIGVAFHRLRPST